MSKYCRICKEDKPLSKFKEFGGSQDGVLSYCKSCSKKSIKEQQEWFKNRIKNKLK